jgi:Ribonuclease G/E
MVTVTCQDCGRTMELNEHYVEGMLESGDLVKASRLKKVTNPWGQEVDTYVESLFDVCKACRGRGVVPAKDSTLTQQMRIQAKVRLLREARPDLDFEGRVHAAVEEEFDPKYESNLAFRKFLVERQGL